jgi:hypothetical protein
MCARVFNFRTWQIYQADLPYVTKYGFPLYY